MFLLPAHYFEPCSSSLSHFLVSPGHVSHVFTGRTFAFFLSPDGELLLSGLLCEPSHHGRYSWDSFMSRTQMDMPRVLSSNISKARLVPTIPVTAYLCCGTWKAGCFCCLQCLEGSSAQTELSTGVRPCDSELRVHFAQFFFFHGRHSGQVFSTFPDIRTTQSTRENINVWHVPCGFRLTCTGSREVWV